MTALLAILAITAGIALYVAAKVRKKAQFEAEVKFLAKKCLVTDQINNKWNCFFENYYMFPIDSQMKNDIRMLSIWMVWRTSGNSKLSNIFMVNSLNKLHGSTNFSKENAKKSILAYNKALEYEVNRKVQLSIATTICEHIVNDNQDYIHLESELPDLDAIAVYDINSEFAAISKFLYKLKDS